MNRNRIMIVLLAALVIVAGGIYGVNKVNACGTCPAHAQAKAASTTDAAVQKADATVQTANAKMTSGDACCATGQAAQTAGVQKAAGTCATQTDARLTGAGSACATKTDAGLTNAKGACTSGARTASAKGECDWAGAMSAEATLTKLAQCGIDINAAEAHVLAAKLAEKGCAGYTAEQWAAMITSARALDTEKSEAILAGAKGKICTSDECPMTLVASELRAKDTESTKN